MMERLRALQDRFGTSEPEPEPVESRSESPALRLLAAHLLVVTGAQAARDRIRDDDAPPVVPFDDRIGLLVQPDPQGNASDALAWAPLVIGPAAAAAQAALALSDSHSARVSARVLGGAALGLSAAVLADTLATQGRGRGTLGAPLAFGAAALLGLLLDRAALAPHAAPQPSPEPARGRRVRRRIVVRV